MARLVSSLGAPGVNATLVRRADGDLPGYALFNGYPPTGAVYPDTSSSVDIIKPNFGIPNTFYLRFIRNGNLTKFQIMYRYRKRYAPSAAAALDSSGSDVWTDWTDWATEKGTTGDPGEEVATTKLNNNAAIGVTVWQKALAHTYKEGDEFDRVTYQFRVRVYNPTANTCGAWTSWTFDVRWVPAITGIAVKKRAAGGYDVSVQTNAQRDVYANVAVSQYPVVEYSGVTNYHALNSATVVNKAATPDGLSFVIPPAHIKNDKAYFRFSQIGLNESFGTTARFLGTAAPSWGRPPCAYTPQDRTEPTLPTPTITADTSARRLQVYVVSSGDNYTDVQGSAQWTDLAGTERTQALDFSYNSTTKKWTATFPRPPLDVEMQLRIAVVGDDWALHTATATVPSEGLVCFDSPTSQTSAGAVRLKYNQSIATGDEIAGETVECVGREFPISRYGGPLKRTIKLDAQMLNPDEPNVGGDGWKNSVECLTQPTDWILRIPGGEVYRVLVSSLDRNTATPTNTKVMDVSITCEVLGYDTV